LGLVTIDVREGGKEGRLMKKSLQDDFWLATVVTDIRSDSHWDSGFITFGTKEQVGRVVDLKLLPFGSRVAKGAKACRKLAQLLKEETRYCREKEAQREMAGRN
jgi:hypothetical protein